MFIQTDVAELANLIYHEARGEGQDGQIAVGQVALNRLRSGKWGVSIHSVAWAKGQFSGIRYHSVNQQMLDLAQGILDGKYANLVGNSLNFNAIRRNGCKIRIKHHCFF
jgi:spore germination cell wall hydrolase CwlJ-like protein